MYDSGLNPKFWGFIAQKSLPELKGTLRSKIKSFVSKEGRKTVTKVIKVMFVNQTISLTKIELVQILNILPSSAPVPAPASAEMVLFPDNPYRPTTGHPE